MKHLAILSLMLTVAFPAWGQGQMDMYGLFHLPQENLSASGYRPGAGFGIDLRSAPIGQAHFLNLQLGTSFTFISGREEAFEVPVIDHRVETGELTIRNQIFGLHGTARLTTPDRLPVQLYGEALLGTRIFSSQEVLYLDLDHDEYCPEPDNIVRRAALSYGASAGLRWRLGPYSSLDFRATWLTGNQAPFVDLATTHLVEEGVVGYDVISTPRIESLSFQAGISFLLVEGPNCQPARSSMECFGCWSTLPAQP